MTSAEKSYNLNTLYSNEEHLDWYPQVAPANPSGPPQPPGYGPDGSDYLPQRGGFPSKQPSYSDQQQNYSAGQSYPQAQRPPQQQQGYTANQAYPHPPQQGYAPGQIGYPPQASQPQQHGYPAGLAYPQPPPSQQPGLGQTYPQAPPPPPMPSQGYSAGQTYPQPQGYAGQTGYPPQAPQPQQGYAAGQAYPQPPPPQQPGLSCAWQQGGGGLYPPQDQTPVYQGYYPPPTGYDQPWQQGGGGLYPPPPTYSTAYAPQQGTAAPLYSQSYQRVESVSTNAQHPEYKTTKTKESRSRSFSQGLRDLFHKGVVPATREVSTRSRSLSEGLRTTFTPEGHSNAAPAEDQGLAAEETLVARSTEITDGGEQQHEEKKERKKQKMVDSVATGLKALVVAGEALQALDVLSSLAS